LYRNIETKLRRKGAYAVKVLRFAVPALCLLGIAVCIHALARVVGWAPPGKLPPYPAWASIHFLTAAGFAVLAPLQLWAGPRTRRPSIHRTLGRVAVALGALMALSGLAAVYTAPDRPVSELIFMTALFLSYGAMLGLGVRAALVRDFAGHRAWMVRMTATGLAALTQRLLFPLFAVGFGIDSLATFWQLFVSTAWLAWGLNMVVAEAWLGRVRAVPRLGHA
jgi:uncharacterized membrane protein